MKSLFSKLNDAIRDSIGICEIDQFIGQKSIINTCSENDRMAISGTHFVADNSHSVDFPDLTEAKEAAYWLLSHESEYTRVIGIYWPKAGKPVIFKARIYPP